MVQVTASVRRPRAEGAVAEGFIAVPLEGVVPGDIVRLAAGDLVPADLRLLVSHDLYVNESALTGEAMPVEKSSQTPPPGTAAPDAPNLCFMGSSVVSGYATGVLLATGRQTFFGSIAQRIVAQPVPSDFDGAWASSSG